MAIININDLVTETVILDERDEAVAVKSGGSVATANAPSVITKNNRNRITVNRNGLLQSDQTAAQIEGNNTVIQNSGTIDGLLNGVDFASDSSTRGQLINKVSGIVTSDSRAVNLGGNRITVKNSGLIQTVNTASDGVIRVAGSADNFVIENQGKGVIEASEGASGTGILLDIGDSDGDIIKGRLINDGRIEGRNDDVANSQQGDGIRLSSGVAPDIIILGVGLRANLENRRQGKIIAADDGIEIERKITLRGNINNRGEIVAENDGIIIAGQVTGNLNTTGTITAGDEGIEIGGDGQIGKINIGGRVSGGIGEAIEIDGITGDINNRGILFSADEDGISIDNAGTVDGNINNFGEIQSPTDVGIRVDGTLTGSINNTGQIAGVDASIDADGANESITVNNRGTLSGDVLLSNFDDVFNSSRGVVEGDVFGFDGDDLLTGGRGVDNLAGGNGDDTLTGGRGRDTFIFDTSEFGADIITDFQNGIDQIEVDGGLLGAANTQSIVANAQQIGNDTLITLGVNNTALLKNFQAAQLDAGDFSRLSATFSF